MRLEISSTISINANVDKVWQVLTQFEKYPDWNPFIKSLSGNVAVGKYITVTLEPPGAKGMTFKPKVLAMEPNNEFRWLGHVLFPGLFDGEHSLKVVDNGNGTTTFVHSEKFKGMLVPLFKKMLTVNTKEGFVQMNNKLKELAES